MGECDFQIDIPMDSCASKELLYKELLQILLVIAIIAISEKQVFITFQGQ